MKHLKGHSKRYFSLATIAMYATLHKLSWIDVNYQHHKKAFAYQEYKTSPPFLRMILNKI
jgi:hypothetical protein